MKRLLMVSVLCLLPAALAGQQRAATDFRAELIARGVSAEFAGSAAVIADSAAAKGLPARPILDKAVEGWGKQVAAARIIVTLRELSARLERTRGELSASGEQDVDGETLAAAAQARFRGIHADNVSRIVAVQAPRASVIAGLQVAGALAGQGLDQGTSARLVVESLRRGRTVAQMLDLPAAARALAAAGASTTQVGQQLLQGLDAGVTVTGRGQVGVTVPPVLPPGLPIKP